MKGNGSARGLWNCLLDRHPRDLRPAHPPAGRDLVGCEKCVISLYEADTREFVCQWPGHNVADELLKKVRYPADPLESAWNFRHQGPMVNKRPEEFNEEQRAFLRPFGVYNLTEIPLVHEGRFIGKISVANKPGGLSENDVRLVTVFDTSAAPGVGRPSRGQGARADGRAGSHVPGAGGLPRPPPGGRPAQVRLPRQRLPRTQDAAGGGEGLRRQPPGRRGGAAHRQAPTLPRPRPRQYRTLGPHGIGSTRSHADRGRGRSSPSRERCRSRTWSERPPTAFATWRTSAGSAWPWIWRCARRCGRTRTGCTRSDESPGERPQVQSAGRSGGGHGAARPGRTRAPRGRGWRAGSRRPSASGYSTRLPGGPGGGEAAARHRARSHHRTPPGRARRRADLGGGRAAGRAAFVLSCPRRAARPSDGVAGRPGAARRRGRSAGPGRRRRGRSGPDRLRPARPPAGYRVLTACDGIEALARAKEARPGCIILDLKMPRRGRFEVLPERSGRRRPPPA